MTDVAATVEAVWRLESARIVGALTRLVHDVELATELAQDAFVAAVEQWPRTGVPDNPGAWLTAIAKRRAVDHLRRREREERATERLEHEPEPESAGDDVLRLMFLSCHPVLPTPARVALTLRLVGGLGTAEIARAFLTDEPRIARRIAEAKRTLAQERVPFELPAGTERLASVLEVLYLVFNEGYSATSGDDLMRPGLCREALRLGRMLAELAPGEPEVHGLVALMELQQSRAAARTGPRGEIVQLHLQDRGKWDQLLVRRGFAALLRARELGRPPGPYVLQAAIAACHAQARTAEATDWAQIAALYGLLAQQLPTPVVALNRAVAIGMAAGPEAGLAAVDALRADPALRDYHLLPGVRGDLLLRLGRAAEARPEFERAAQLTGNAAEREFLLARAAALPAAADGPSLGSAAAAFLAELDGPTARSYAQTLRVLRRAVGDGVPLAEVTAEQAADAFAAAWGSAAAATWNRHRAALRSFGTRAGVDLAAGVDRRTGAGSPTRPLAPALVDALCARPDLPLRERALWRLLHESGAPVRAVLALDVPDLDLADRRARSGSGWIAWRGASAALLAELVAGRAAGPVFRTDRRAAPGHPDVCPESGRGRLSYERAEYLFKRATGGTATLSMLKPR